MERPELSKFISIIHKLQDDVLKTLSSSTTATLDHQAFLGVYNASLEFFNQKKLNQDQQAYLINWYEASLDNYLKRLEFSNLTGEPLLKEFLRQWDNFEIFVSVMKKALVWLDMNAFPTLTKMTLRDLSYCKFRKTVSDFMATELFETISNFLEKEREKELSIRKTVKRAIDIYDILGNADIKPEAGSNIGEMSAEISAKNNPFFIKTFETQLIKRMKEYYKVKSAQWISLPLLNYLVEFSNALRFEENQCYFYYPKSQVLIKQTLIQEICTLYGEQSVQNNSDIFAIFETKQYESLTKTYLSLATGEPEHLKFLSQAYENYIKSTGEKITAGAEASNNPTYFTTRAIDLKKEMDKILSDCFMSDEEFQNASNRGFKHFLNKSSRIPVHLNYYIKHQFTNSSLIKATNNLMVKATDQDQIEEMLADFTKIVGYLASIDIFMSGYNILLAKRLLSSKCLSSTVEKSLLSKLSSLYGAKTFHYPNKILTEYDENDELKRQFSSGYPKNPIEVLVCSPHWSNLSADSQSEMPNEMKQWANEFANYYLKLPQNVGLFYNFPNRETFTKTRRFGWVLSEGEGEISARFGSTRYILKLQTYRMLILLWFNEKEQYTFEELKKLTKLEPDILREVLSYFISQIPLLKREGESNEEEDFDERNIISVNEEFKSEKKKIKCTSSDWKKVEKQKKISQHFEDEMKKERDAVLDAMIVKVAKLRRVIRTNDIIVQLKKQATLFDPEPKMVLKRVENLIERGYLRKDEAFPDLIIYVD